MSSTRPAEESSSSAAVRDGSTSEVPPSCPPGGCDVTVGSSSCPTCPSCTTCPMCTTTTVNKQVTPLDGTIPVIVFFGVLIAVPVAMLVIFCLCACTHYCDSLKCCCHQKKPADKNQNVPTLQVATTSANIVTEASRAEKPKSLKPIVKQVSQSSQSSEEESEEAAPTPKKAAADTPRRRCSAPVFSSDGELVLAGDKSLGNSHFGIYQNIGKRVRQGQLSSLQKKPECGPKLRGKHEDQDRNLADNIAGCVSQVRRAGRLDESVVIQVEFCRKRAATPTVASRCDSPPNPRPPIPPSAADTADSDGCGLSGRGGSQGDLAGVAKPSRTESKGYVRGPLDMSPSTGTSAITKRPVMLIPAL